MRYQELVPVIFAIIARAAVPTDTINISWIAECRARQQGSLVNFYYNLMPSTCQIKGNIVFFFTFYSDIRTFDIILIIYYILSVTPFFLSGVFGESFFLQVCRYLTLRPILSVRF